MAASAAANTGHSHRAGKLKQQNKKNKRTSSSKRSLNRRKGAGKVQSGTAIVLSSSSKNHGSIVTSSHENKANRLNAIKQRREASKKNGWNARRFLLLPATTATAGVNDAADVTTTTTTATSTTTSSNSRHNIILASLQRALSSSASSSDPPRVIGIISLSEVENSLEESVRTALMEYADQIFVAVPSSSSSSSSSVSNNAGGKRSIVTASYSASSFASNGGGGGGGKQNHHQQQPLTLLANYSSFTPQYSQLGYHTEDASVQGALDLCRVCDLVLFLIDGGSSSSSSSSSRSSSSGNNIGGRATNHASDDAATTTTTGTTTSSQMALDDLISLRGERILTAIKAQGLPTPVTVVVHTVTSSSSPSTATSTTTTAPADMRITEVDNDAKEDDDAIMDEDEDDDDEEDDEVEEMVDYLPSSKNRARSCSSGGLSYASHRSMKSIRRSYLRKRAEMKRYVSRFAATEFGEAGNKVVEIDIVPNIGCGDSATMVEEGNASVPTTATAASAAVKSFHEMNTSIAALIRILCTISASGPSWVADASRPYLVTDGCMSTTNKSMNMTTPSPVQYDAVSHELKLTGYIRGNTLWNVNRPVHIPHLGTYSVKDVRLAGVHVFEQEKQQQGQKLLVLPPIVAAGRKHRKKGKTNTKGAENNVEIMNDEELDGRGGDSGENDLLLAESNIDEREPLDMFASPDALEGEQNLIGFDEDHDIDADPYDEDEDGQGGFGDRGGRGAGSNNTKQFQPGTTRPAGWSDYQSAWLDALDGEGDAEDHGELAFALNNKSGNKTNKYSSNDTLMGDDDDGDETEINAEAKRAFLAQRKKDASVDLQFPDEVDYEEETSARDRYARYRALKSFRKSYWDPKENLPMTYGAIYHFASFKSTQRDVLEDVRGLEEVVKRRGWGVVGVEQRSVSKRPGEDDNDSMNMADERDSDDDEEEEEAMMARACVPPGAYVTITLENVPPAAIANLSPHTLLCAVSLLPHENKVSVLHMGLAHSSKSEHDAESLPVKSKDVLTFRCGWRTWQSRPIFSQHNLNSDKHKFERFMPTGGGGSSGTFFAGSIFGPVSYAPCPVMMFREARVGGQQQDGTNSVSEGGGVGGIKREFLAQGSILGADADRIVMKRIVLTGYPTRVHKRHATVKYMFYNPEDVKWFMPAGITTKHGLQGNIIQSVGDHGVMKCLFNAPIKQHDTVCLPLYKRIFPKFAPVSKMVGNGAAGEDGTTAGDGVLMKDFRVL